MKYNPDTLKLIFIHKIGYNTKGEGLYEFIFSLDETNVDIEGWCWDISPACDNAMPPTSEFINTLINLKTLSFDLFCLHEAVDREYMHGYHTIHALAYETEKQNDDGFNSYSEIFDDDLPLLVFHYGMTLLQIIDIFSVRNIILKNNEFIDVSSVKL